MPKKYIKCVKSVEKRMKKGKIPKHYYRGKRKIKSSAYAICRKATGYYGTTHKKKRKQRATITSFGYKLPKF